MPSIPLHPPSPSHSPRTTPQNPLPPLFHTPAGLALVEIQGTINLPPVSDQDGDEPDEQTQVGTLHFPEYDPAVGGEGEGKWMKKVYLYVGRHQRLMGSVVKMKNAVAVVRRRERVAQDSLGWNGEEAVGKGERREGEDEEERGEEGERGEKQGQEELEVVEIVRYKIVFSSRPEPVDGGGLGEGGVGG